MHQKWEDKSKPSDLYVLVDEAEEAQVRRAFAKITGSDGIFPESHYFRILASPAGGAAMIDLHTHTFLSDGELGPAELVRRAEHAGYRAIGITDHADASNLDDLISALVQFVRETQPFVKIRIIPGVELTHVPPGQISGLVRRARQLGARLVLLHGETVCEPVALGTNRAGHRGGDRHPRPSRAHLRGRGAPGRRQRRAPGDVRAFLPRAGKRQGRVPGARGRGRHGHQFRRPFPVRHLHAELAGEGGVRVRAHRGRDGTDQQDDDLPRGEARPVDVFRIGENTRRRSPCSLLCTIINVVLIAYLFILSLRIVLGWFAPQALGRAWDLLAGATDPYLELFARIRFLRGNLFDFSPIAAILALVVALDLVNQLLYYGRITLGFFLASVFSAAWSGARFLLLLLPHRRCSSHHPARVPLHRRSQRSGRWWTRSCSPSWPG